jgi:hypothetical protein
MTLLATQSLEHARLYLRLSALGHFGLIPLLFRSVETPLVICSYMAFSTLAHYLLQSSSFCSRMNHRNDNNNGDNNNNNNNNVLIVLTTQWDRCGMYCVLPALAFLLLVVHPLVLQPRERMEFLPLLATSVVLALGLLWCWYESARLMWKSTHQ